MRKKRHWPAGRALVLAALRRRSRDVEVHPRIALGEPRKEARRGDRAVAARADANAAGQYGRRPRMGYSKD